MKVLPISSANSPSRTRPSTLFCSSSLRVWRDHPGIIILLMESRQDSATLSIKSSWTLLWCIKLFSSSSRTAFSEGVVEVLVVHFLLSRRATEAQVPSCILTTVLLWGNSSIKYFRLGFWKIDRSCKQDKSSILHAPPAFFFRNVSEPNAQLHHMVETLVTKSNAKTETCQ